MKKEGETPRPFRCDLNEIPYEYTVEVTNRFKGLDRIERVPEELCMEVPNIVQEAVIKPIPKKKKCKQAKRLSEEALQIAEKRIPDHLTCILRNLYVGQEATVRTRHGKTNWFQIGKG